MEKKSKHEQTTCRRGDRDFPEMICGYPLPCPWHTVILNLKPNPPTITIPATMSKAVDPVVLNKLKKIAAVLKE